MERAAHFTEVFVFAPVASSLAGGTEAQLPDPREPRHWAETAIGGDG